MAVAVNPHGRTMQHDTSGPLLTQWPHAKTNRFSAAFGTGMPESGQEVLMSAVSAYPVEDPTGVIGTATREFTADPKFQILYRVFHGTVDVQENDAILLLADLQFVDDNGATIKITTYEWGDATPQLAAPLTVPMLTQFTKESRLGGMSRAIRGIEIDWGSMYHDDGLEIIGMATREMQKATLLLIKRLILLACFNTPRHWSKLTDYNPHADTFREFFEPIYGRVGILTDTHDGQGLARLVDDAVRAGNSEGVSFDWCIVPQGVKTVLTQANPQNFQYMYVGPPGKAIVESGHRAPIIFDNRIVVAEDDSIVPEAHDRFFLNGVACHPAEWGESFPLLMPSEMPDPGEWTADRQSTGIILQRLNHFACMYIDRAAEFSCAFIDPRDADGDNLTGHAPAWMRGGKDNRNRFRCNFALLHERLINSPNPSHRNAARELTSLFKYMVRRLEIAQARQADIDIDILCPDGLYDTRGGWTDQRVANDEVMADLRVIDARLSRAQPEQNADETAKASRVRKESPEPEASAAHPSKKTKKSKEKSRRTKEEGAVGMSMAILDDEDEGFDLDTVPGAQAMSIDPSSADASGERTESADAAGVRPGAGGTPAIQVNRRYPAPGHMPGLSPQAKMLWYATWGVRAFRAWRKLGIPVPVSAWVFRRWQHLMGDTLFCGKNFVKAFMGPPKFHQGKDTAHLKMLINYEIMYGVHIIDPARGIAYANTAWMRYQNGANDKPLKFSDDITRFLSGMADMMVVLLPPWVTERDCQDYVPITGKVDPGRDFFGAMQPGQGGSELEDFLENKCIGAFADVAESWNLESALDNSYPDLIFANRERNERTPQDLVIHRNTWYPVASRLIYDRGTMRASCYKTGCAGTKDVYPGVFTVRNIDNRKAPPAIPVDAKFECIDDI